MTAFVGRVRELALLDKRLERVSTTSTGTALTIRGRRQVGKSRLVQEFCDRSELPYLYYTAVKGASPVEAGAAFLAELRRSTLVRDRELVPQNASGDWSDVLRVLATSLPEDRPSIVVIDELPWLSEQDEAFDGALQAAWDRTLSVRPVLLLLLGSDLHMMARFTTYDRPFYGREDNLVLDPLNPAEAGKAVGLSGAAAIDAHLVSGGLPGILRAWPHGMPALDFVRQECADPASPIFGVPETTLLAEFPAPDAARRVLEAVGSGERTHANIAAAAGGRQGALPSGTLSPLLRRLVEDKRVLAVDHPLSTQPGKPALYRIVDSNLRLYLAVLRDAQALTQRGRHDAAYDTVRKRWSTWRGRAVEPLVREAIHLAADNGNLPWGELGAVGGWWNRQFDPEIDLVGADRAPTAARVHFAGSVKWLESPFDRHDLSNLIRGARQIPGFDPSDSGLIVVSLSGTTDDLRSVDIVWSAEDVASAWSA